MSGYSKGEMVVWNWGSGQAVGKIAEVFTSEITRTIEGSEVTREASEDDPAYLITQVDGDGRVLKSHSEVEDATKKALYQAAQEQDIEGRSSMDKKELKEQVS